MGGFLCALGAGLAGDSISSVPVFSFQCLLPANEEDWEGVGERERNQAEKEESEHCYCCCP